MQPPTLHVTTPAGSGAWNGPGPPLSQDSNTQAHAHTHTHGGRRVVHTAVWKLPTCLRFISFCRKPAEVWTMSSKQTPPCCLLWGSLHRDREGGLGAPAGCQDLPAHTHSPKASTVWTTQVVLSWRLWVRQGQANSTVLGDWPPQWERDPATTWPHVVRATQLLSWPFGADLLRAGLGEKGPEAESKCGQTHEEFEANTTARPSKMGGAHAQRSLADWLSCWGNLFHCQNDLVWSPHSHGPQLTGNCLLPSEAP